MDDAGNVTPLYDKAQTIPGGAGDLMLTFTGFPGSGTEFCDVTTQTLTRGSQYQTSFLPEMENGQTYKVMVSATYKDFLPLQFAVHVDYIPNLDEKTKFVDLGTHIFYKNTTTRPVDKFDFQLHGVSSESVDDDQSSYSLTLVDESKFHSEYFALEGQENVIDLTDEESLSIPKIGLNTAIVKDEDGSFLNSERKFFALKGQQTQIEMPLVAKLKDGELAVVLTWTQGSHTESSNVEIQDLDLHVEFQPTDTVKCIVDHTLRQCNGVKLITDSLYTDGEVKNIQAIKFDKLGDFNYMVYASRNKKTVPQTPSNALNV